MKEAPAQTAHDDPGPDKPRFAPRIPTPAPPLSVQGVFVPAGEGTVPVPPSCACCGARAAEALAEAGPAGRSIIVPYCSPCYFHASSVGTRRLSLALSSLVVGLSLLAGLPLSGLALSPGTYGLLIVLGAAVPFAVGRYDFRRPALEHTCRGRAVWWSRDGELRCTRSMFAAEIAVALGREPFRRRQREPIVSARLASVALVPAACSPLVYHVVHPTVRVLNLTPTRVTVLADDRPVVTLGPTSQESPRAGAEVRLLAGTRRLSAIDADGTVVDERTAWVALRAEHLYTPGAEGVCFWLEHTAYGRARDVGVERIVEPIGVGSGFWSIHRAIDTWFAPNPTTGDDARSTGGELTALRQAPCLEAPLAVRSLMLTSFGSGTFAPSSQ